MCEVVDGGQGVVSVWRVWEEVHRWIPCDLAVVFLVWSHRLNVKSISLCRQQRWAVSGQRHLDQDLYSALEEIEPNQMTSQRCFCPPVVLNDSLNTLKQPMVIIEISLQVLFCAFGLKPTIQLFIDGCVWGCSHHATWFFRSRNWCAYGESTAVTLQQQEGLRDGQMSV